MKQCSKNFWHLGRKKCSRGVSILLSLALVFGLLMPFHAEAAGNEPSVVKAQLASARDIEIYWDQKVVGADAAASFAVTVDGKKIEITKEPWIWDEESWSWLPGGIVCYTTRNSFYPDNPDQWKTSISLPKGIPAVSGLPVGNKDAVLPEIKVEIKAGSIRNEAGAYVPQQTVTVDTYEPFYQQEVKLDCGVRVLGSKKVRPEAMGKAAEMLEVLLANKAVAKRMGDAGCMLGLYGEGEIAYDILEHRYGYDENFLYVEGFGGTQLASIKDANVLRLVSGDYTTGYPNESILSHEFGHTVQNYGLSDGQKQEFEEIFKASRAKGKWDNSYAGSNSSEYFATLTAIWFNAMDDTQNGMWDGVRGPINTREELKAYDREAYDFMSEIYVSDQYLPAPWENGTVPDNFTYESPDEPEPEPEPGPGPEPEPEPEPEPGPGPEKPEPAAKTFKVRFAYHNGKKDVVKSVKEGKKVKAPTEPKREGYYFEGWYLNKKPYSFGKKVTKNLVLDAKWSQIKKPTVSSVKAKKGRKATITFRLNNAKANGCKITYSKDKKFKKSVKTKTISSKKAAKWTTKKLSKGTYYFKVQAYRLNAKKAKIFGKASKTVKVTVK